MTSVTSYGERESPPNSDGWRLIKRLMGFPVLVEPEEGVDTWTFDCAEAELSHHRRVNR